VAIAAVPELSVVIPAYNRPNELRLCLEGFSRQTSPRDSFEVVVVDDGSAVDLEPVVDPFRNSLNVNLIRTGNSGCAGARNLAIGHAAAELLLLYDDDLRPGVDTVQSCIEFHARHRDVEHALLLGFAPDPSLGDCRALEWAFPLLYAFPKQAGIYGWHLFWGGTLTCKKSLFAEERFDPAFRSLEDMDMGLRLSKRFDLRIHFDGSVRGTMTRGMRFPDICRRQYVLGYYVFQLMRAYASELGRARPPYDDPERHQIADPAELRLLQGAAARGVPVEIWTRLELHARVSGWISARDGGDPPGSAGNPVPAFE